MKRTRIAAAAFAAALIGACKGTEPGHPMDHASGPAAAAEGGAGNPVSKPKPVNPTCPIMGGEVDPRGETAAYNGRAIGFCCDGCKPEREALDDQKKSAFVAEAVKR